MKTSLIAAKVLPVLLFLSTLQASAAPALLVSCNVPSGHVLRYNGETGAFVDTFVPSIRTPRGLALGPDGNVYVSSHNEHTVLRYEIETGDLIDTFASGGGLSFPWDLAFGNDGYLYVSSGIPDGGVYRYDGVTGDFVDIFVAPEDELTSFTGMVFGPDGNLFVSDFGNNRVLRYDGETGVLMGTFASGGGLIYPHGLTFGPDGNLYVAAGGNDAVLRYDGTTGAFLDTFASGGGLNEPQDVSFGPDGNLYVCSAMSDAILRYNGTTGAFMDIFAQQGGMDAPMSLLFVPVIPEPATLSLLVLGGLAILRRGSGRMIRRRR